ncbi:MAG: hypothetical protein ACJ8BW_10440 [Ktedonobacteraceae bacterium]
MSELSAHAELGLGLGSDTPFPPYPSPAEHFVSQSWAGSEAGKESFVGSDSVPNHLRGLGKQVERQEVLVAQAKLPLKAAKGRRLAKARR